MRNVTFKTVVFAAIILIVLLLLSRVEIDDFKIKTITYPALWLAIGILGFWFYRKLLGTNSALRKSIFGIGFALYVLCSLYFFLSFFLCAEITSGSKYLHRMESTLSLECRSYECYGTTGSCELYTLRSLTDHIKWVTKYDGDTVDLNIWDKVRH